MSSLTIQKVAVAGINGSLGPTVIPHLLAANFSLTILTRSRQATLDAWPNTTFASIVEVDYTSPESLTIALRGHDALVSLISRLDASASNTLHDAAAAAGVPHVIPSCFGANHRLQSVRENPALKSKIEMEEHVEKLAAQGLITYTGIHQGALLDWGLRRGLFANMKGPTLVFNGGDIPFSATLLDDLAKAVVNALRNPDETKNRYLYIQSAVVTQNQLLALCKDLRPDQEFPRTELDSQVLADQSWEAYNRGERGYDAMRGFLAHMTFGQRQGLFDSVDNEVLGVEELSEEALKEVVKGVMDEVSPKDMPPFFG